MPLDTRYFVHPSKLLRFALTPDDELDTVITRLSYYTLPELRKFFAPLEGVLIMWKNAGALPQEAKAFEKALARSIENPADSRDNMLYALAQIVNRNLTQFLAACRKPVADAFWALAKAGTLAFDDIPSNISSENRDTGIFALARFQLVDGRNSLVVPPVIREALGIKPSQTAVADTPPSKKVPSKVPVRIPDSASHSFAMMSPSEVCKAFATADFVRRQSGKPQSSLADARTTASMVSFPQLPEDVLAKGPKPVPASRLFLNVFGILDNRLNYMRRNAKIEKPGFPERLRSLISFFREEPHFDLTFIVDNVKHLGGLSYAVDAEASRTYLSMCLDMIQRLGANWVSLPSKMMELRTALVQTPGAPLPLPVSPRSLNVYNAYRSGRQGYYGYGYRGGSLDEFADIALPVLRCFLAVLCTFGIVELAVGPAPAKSAVRFSQFDAIDSFRLTPLGMYALGITDEVPEFEPYEIKNCRLDEVYPFIYVPETLTSMYGPYLKKIGKPIGATRYAVSEETLMSGIRKREELHERIRSFRAFVGDELPPVWQALVERIEKKASSVQPHGSYYVSLKLDPDNAELINFAMTDETIRHYCVRGENCTLFVPTASLDIVISAFTEAGYLLS